MDNSLNYSNMNISKGIDEICNVSKLKKDYWIKYKLYDVKVENNLLKNLIVCNLDKDTSCYLYSNKLITYYFIKNIHFGKDYSINDKIIKDKEYNEAYGLFFCGKKIEIEKNEIQKCLPDNMICTNCMDKNRKRHNLENTYLININGRVAMKYNDQYHCFGHFLVGNQMKIVCKTFLVKHVNY